MIPYVWFLMRNVLSSALLAFGICVPAHASVAVTSLVCAPTDTAGFTPTDFVTGAPFVNCPSGTTAGYLPINVIQANDVFLASAQTDTFDPVVGGAVFGAFFASVIVLFILGRSVGLILEAVKKW